MAEKKLDSAVRCNISPASVEEIGVKTTQGAAVGYRLLSIPLYLAERLPEVMTQI